MQRPEGARDYYSQFPRFSRDCAAAHSGPELASCVPDSQLAQDLARELLSEQFELARCESRAFTAAGSCAGYAGSVTIGLARR